MRIRWVSLALILLITAATVREAPAAKFEGFYVYDSEGKATLTRNKKSLPLRSDTQLLPGDVLKSEAASSMHLALLDSISMSFKEFSHLEIKNNYPSEQHLICYNGEVLVNAKKMLTGTKLNIETPSAIIRLQLPAQFFFKVYTNAKGKRTTTMAVKKGKVGIFFKGSSATMNILEEQAVDVEVGGFVSNPRQGNEKELAKAAKANSVIIIKSNEI